MWLCVICGWRSSRDSELGLQTKPESQLCETAPTPKDSWAKRTSQSDQITPSHPFAEEADRHSSSSIASWLSR